MKTQLESIRRDANSSFHLMRNPRLSDLFFWHFHPEYELVYIEGTNGTRHVGNHISEYSDSDLVLIGSNIPHLNFDYGVKTDYEKVVLHIQPSFKERVLNEAPELSEIHQLFERSQQGIAFLGETKKHVGHRMKSFHQLYGFDQFIEVLQLFQALAQSNEYLLLHDQPYINRYNKKAQERLRRVYAFIDDHYQQKIEVDTVASLCNLTKSAFCRYFRQVTGQTFIGFLNHYRISQAKRLLMMGKSVSEACYDSGFESLSYFNRMFKRVAGENPGRFRFRHLNSN